MEDLNDPSARAARSVLLTSTWLALRMVYVGANYQGKKSKFTEQEPFRKVAQDCGYKFYLHMQGLGMQAGDIMKVLEALTDN